MKAMLGLVVLIAILISVYLACFYHSSSQRLQPAEYRCKPEGGPPWAILQGEEARDLAQLWCAGAPGEPKAYWSPSPQEIARLESRLTRFMEEKRDSEGVAPLSSYVRQYAGFTDKERRTICVNLYAAKVLQADVYAIRSDPMKWKYLPKGVCPEDQWRHELLAAEDGGTLFCGVSYEPGLESFTGLACNGD